MKISRIESLVYGVEDLDAGIRYFEDWGVPLVKRGAGGADFRLPSGQTIVVRQAADKSLPATAETGSTLREIVWGVDGASSLKAIGKELARDREVSADKDGTLHARDECGFAIAFRERRATKKAAVKKPPPRMNRPFDPERRARPQRLGHVVYSTRMADLAPASRFYQERLGFRLSDATPGGDFLRCSGTHDHHSVFLLARPDRRAFNHVAFEVSGLDEIILGGKFMVDRGWKPDSPVGRHILGSNLFWYFNNPCGGRTEYYADMDQMNDQWKPRVWKTHPGFAMWTLDKTDTAEIPIEQRLR
jgi:catechol 2,3-dioxygenase-like lactoylglutathione lyase family enzyme